MSNNSNDDDNGAIIAISLVGGVVWAMASLMVIGIAFVCFVFTIMSLLSLWSPLTFGNKVLLWPHQARNFLWIGLLGLICVPCFAVTAALLGGHGHRITWDAIETLAIIGWVGASMSYIFFADHDNAPEMIELRRQAELENQPPPMKEINPPAFDGDVPEIKFRGTLPAPKKPEPFRFASWDDEEEFR